MSPHERIEANIEQMVTAASDGTGMDVVIVSTSSAVQEVYWQERLEASRGQITGTDCVVLAVNEDWPGGAGNGLGTLYAWQCARRKAQSVYGIDLQERLRDGAAVGLYHTAGKGTRLAPLPASESNNKPGVKLPGVLSIHGQAVAITILEAVIRQTSIYAPSRRGRLSVFWGDQIFIPDIDVAYEPRHHADILCILGEMPDAEAWAAQGMDKYGLIAADADGTASQVEKISHGQARQLVDSKKIAVAGGIGVSMGSFSISSALTECLLDEFHEELDARQGKLDTDPHFWMPMTLDPDTYRGIMMAKGNEASAIDAHHQRIRNMVQRLPEGPLFGAVDVGAGAYWWDYGQLRNYYRHNLELTSSHHEAACMRRFFDIAPQPSPGLDVDAHSILQDCDIKTGTIRNSVLVGVRADSVVADGSLLLYSAAPSITVEAGLLYNATSDEPIVLTHQCVRADIYRPPTEHLPVVTSTTADGKEDWDRVLPGNSASYADLYDANANIDPQAAEKMAKERRG